MEYIPRLLEPILQRHLQRGKSIFLLGPRQTGKSTLLTRVPSDLTLSLLLPETRLRYEKNPSLLLREIEALRPEKPLVILDEIQKVPQLMDVVQDQIDRKKAQFILTGSSARKLRRGHSLNLLPGRVVHLRLDPFVHSEIPDTDLESFLIFGSLPVIHQEKEKIDREADLKSYVETYLEEEVRSESLVKNLAPFARFLEFAGLESGNIVSFRAISQELGVSHTTVISYFEILEDCLIAERVDPITESKTRKKLMKSSRYLLFVLGVRRHCAMEGMGLGRDRLGALFEQFVGLELIRLARLSQREIKLRYWRDPDGPEVDWVLEKEGKYIPIEVKWSEAPHVQETRHLQVFLKEYPKADKAYVVCRTPRPFQFAKNIQALPWQSLGSLME